MVFRKIYWVVEETRQDERAVVGVFTSNSDLIDRYLTEIGADRPDSFQISLVKLDKVRGVLGTWSSPDFEGLRTDLDDYIATGEFSIDECDQICHQLIGVYA